MLCTAKIASADQASDSDRAVTNAFNIHPAAGARVTSVQVKDLYAARQHLLSAPSPTQAERYNIAYAGVDESLILYAAQNNCMSMLRRTTDDLFTHIAHEPLMSPTGYELPLRLFKSKRYAAAFRLLYKLDRENHLAVNALADSGEDVVKGFRLAASQHYNQAQEAFHVAMRLNSTLPIAHLMLGMIAEAQANHHTAREQYMFVIGNPTFRSASESAEVLSAVRLLSY